MHNQAKHAVQGNQVLVPLSVSPQTAPQNRGELFPCSRTPGTVGSLIIGQMCAGVRIETLAAILYLMIKDPSMCWKL